MKKKVPDDSFKEIKDKTGLSQSEIDAFYQLFSQLDKKGSGSINRNDLDEFFRQFGYFKKPQVQKWLHEELKITGLKSFDFKFLCEMILQVRKQIDELEEEEMSSGEYLDAFVAMGGNSDGTGYISKDTILNVMNEFGLTFDMEEFLEDIGSQNQVDFEMFCVIFESGGEDAKSVITAFSERAKGSQSQFNVKMKDFEKWEQQMLAKT